MIFFIHSRLFIKDQEIILFMLFQMNSIPPKVWRLWDTGLIIISHDGIACCLVSAARHFLSIDTTTDLHQNWHTTDGCKSPGVASISNFRLVLNTKT